MRQRTSRKEIVRDLRAVLRSAFARSELRRIEGMLEIWAESRTPALRTNQQVKGLFIPDLSTNPWLDPDEFSFVAALEDAYPRIKKEWTSFVRKGARLAPYGTRGGAHEARNMPEGWRELPLWLQGRRFKAFDGFFPQTRPLISKVTRHNGWVQQFNFLMLEPGAKIPPHVDAMNFLVTVQMGINVPSDCATEVSGEARTPTEGRCLSFDNSFVHSAWNYSSRPRVLLSIHTAHPRLTVTERSVIKTMCPTLWQLAQMDDGDERQQPATSRTKSLANRPSPTIASPQFRPPSSRRFRNGQEDVEGKNRS